MTNPLTTNTRPSRRNYPDGAAGDLPFNVALVSWQGSELDRLTAERNAANICLFHMQEAAKALLAERDRLALDLAAEERGQDNLRREIVALTAERDRQKALLKRLEFAGLREMCPECGGWMVSDAGCTPRAHTATCELAAALKDQP